MGLFFRREEGIEEGTEVLEEDSDIIDLDHFSGWEQLEIEYIPKEEEEIDAAQYMEEFGDELAIIDAVENDIFLEEMGEKINHSMEHTRIKEEEETAEETDSPEEEEAELTYLSMEEDEEEEIEEELSSGWLAAVTEFFSGLTMLDKLVAVMGIVVFSVAAITVSAYTSNAGTKKQVEAMAPIGIQLESLQNAGKEKLLAVADGKKAMIEAAKLESELNQEYEEKDISKNIQVAMKMTSVEKDLKIKFVNKRNGKLVSSVPFAVEIVDSSNKKYTKIDEDKDGIIYLTKIEPGNYTVTMEELEDIEGYSFSTHPEKIKVKEKIEYQKIDVTDEIKDQSEVNVATEDTAKKESVEAVLKDTVEWVESRKESTASEEKYTKVDKNTIADPSLSASLVTDFSTLSMIMSEINDGEGQENGEEGSSEEEGSKEDNGQQEVTDEVTKLTLSADVSTISESAKTSAISLSVEKKGNPSYSVIWSVDKQELVSLSGSGESATLTLTNVPETDTPVTVTAAVNDKITSITITVKGKPAVEEVQVSKITVVSSLSQMEMGQTADLTIKVEPDTAADKSTEITMDKTEVIKIEETKITALKPGTVKITVTSKSNPSIKGECTVTVKDKAETSIKLDKQQVSLKPKETVTLTAAVTPSGKTVTWSSSKKEVAIVENGKVTAVAKGEAVIWAEADGKKAECKIIVTDGYDPKTDTVKLLKDKSGNQIYVQENGKYVEAKVADYYKHSTFYKKETVTGYRYFGWQNIDGRTYFYDKAGNKVTGEQVIQGAKYTFNSDGSLYTGSGVLGIDVSTWNGNINWTQVKNSGVSYVIIRTGFRGSTQGALVEDNKFRQNIQGALNAGLKVGVYFFTQAINEVEAVEEASMVLSQIKGYKITYPVFIDVESSGGRADGLDAGTRTRVINAFCQTIQSGGYKAGIYANKTWFAQKMNISALSGYKIWLAQYNTHVTYGGRYDMWQYSSTGSVAGISGKVDMNLSYMNY